MLANGLFIAGSVYIVYFKSSINLLRFDIIENNMTGFIYVELKS